MENTIEAVRYTTALTNSANQLGVLINLYRRYLC